MKPVRVLCSSSLVLGLCACQPMLDLDSLPENDSSMALSPVAEVFADGVVSCREHADRNQYNMCPAVRPEVGPDADGVTWADDLFLGVFLNPYHAPLECMRGTSPQLGVSSFHCCYDGDVLVSDGELAGSFDFFVPDRFAFDHFLFDILPPPGCTGD